MNTVRMALFVLGMSTLAGVMGEASARAGQGAALPNSVFLYKVTQPGNPSVGGYLLGTVSALPEERAVMNPAILDAFAASDALYVEPSPRVARESFSPDEFPAVERSIFARVQKDTADRLRKTAEKARLPMATVDVENGVGLPTTLDLLAWEVAGFDERFGQDAQLYASAHRKGMDVRVLANAHWQLFVRHLGELPEDDMVKAAVAQHEAGEALALIRFHAAGDESGAAALLDRQIARFPQAKLLRETLQTVRRDALLKPFREALEKGVHVMAAVHAQHVGGPNGLVQELTRAGFKVDRVAPRPPVAGAVPVDTWEPWENSTARLRALFPAEQVRVSQNGFAVTAWSYSGMGMLSITADSVSSEKREPLEAFAKRAVEKFSDGVKLTLMEPVPARDAWRAAGERDGIELQLLLVQRGRYRYVAMAIPASPLSANDARRSRFKRFLDSIEFAPVPGKVQLEPPVGDGKDLFVQGTLVNLRSAASANAPAVKKLGIGTLCRALDVEQADGFSHVRCGGAEGFMKQDLLATSRPVLAELLAAGTDQTKTSHDRLVAASRAAALEPTSRDAEDALRDATFDDEFSRLEAARARRRPRTLVFPVACREGVPEDACLLEGLRVADAKGHAWEELRRKGPDFVFLMRTRRGMLAVKAGRAARQGTVLEVSVEQQRLTEASTDVWRALAGWPDWTSPAEGEPVWTLASVIANEATNTVPLAGGGALVGSNTGLGWGFLVSAKRPLLAVGPDGAPGKALTFSESGSALLAGELVLFAPMDGTAVTALALDGAHRWTSNLAGVPDSAARLGDTVVVCGTVPNGTGARVVAALNAADGHVLWNIPAQGTCAVSTVGDSFALHDGASVRVVDATGKTLTQTALRDVQSLGKGLFVGVRRTAESAEVKRVEVYDAQDAKKVRGTLPRPANVEVVTMQDGLVMSMESFKQSSFVHGEGVDGARGAWTAPPLPMWGSRLFELRNVRLFRVDDDVLYCSQGLVGVLDAETGILKETLGASGVWCQGMSVDAGSSPAAWLGGRRRGFVFRRGVIPQEHAVVTGTVRFKGKPVKGVRVIVGDSTVAATAAGTFKAEIWGSGVMPVYASVGDSSRWKEAEGEVFLNGKGSYELQLALVDKEYEE